MTYIKSTKNKNHNFSEKMIFTENISKSDGESLNLAFFEAMPCLHSFLKDEEVSFEFKYPYVKNLLILYPWT